MLPTDPAGLAGALPDTPFWVETRSWLRSGADVLVPADPASGSRLVLDRSDPPSGAVVGRPDGDLLRAALAGVAEDFELLVQLDALHDARVILPGWDVALAVLHVRPEPFVAAPAPPDGVVVSSPPDPAVVERLPEGDRAWEAGCDALAVLFVGGEAVASCQAAVTEAWWDVGIDTYEERHRRSGYGTTVFHALASYLAGTGRQPVWCAYPENVASTRFAAKLGFRPVGQIAVLTPPPTEG